MYRVTRKLHLWVGLILAVILLMEAITGLILAEPWLVGQGQLQMPHGGQALGVEQNKAPGIKGSPVQGEGTRAVPSGVFGVAKGLHQGKFGNLDFKWLIDISAVGLVILTLTGVYISIPILRARRKK